MPVKNNANLSAHVLADPFLKGIPGLESNVMKDTTALLGAYIDSLAQNQQSIPKEYQTLSAEMAYLVTVETSTKTPSDLSKEIKVKLDGITADERVLLPGGWVNRSGGHAMVYQFNRRIDPTTGQEEYLFTVFNSGAGINFHSCKTGTDKELYNPKKCWSFPIPKTEKQQGELEKFIARLLKANSRNAQQANKQLMDAEGIYNEVLQSIYHLDGVKDVDADKDLPEHGWTGSQLSGTCSMRVLHQMLKINSKSIKEYQKFIFGFKQFVLEDLASKPITDAVADLIDEGIENDLKILNIKNLFSLEEKERFEKNLFALQHQVKANRPNQPQYSPKPYQQAPALILNRGDDARTPPALGANAALIPAGPYSINLTEPDTLVADLGKIINEIKFIQDPATQCHYLQQVILALPTEGFNDTFYESLKNPALLADFQKHLHALQAILVGLKTNWLKDSRNPAYDVMALSLMALHTDVHDKLMQAQNLPSFRVHDEQVLRHILGNQGRNPFLATDHPDLDRRFRALSRRFTDNTFHYQSEYHAYFRNLVQSCDPDRAKVLTEAYYSDPNFATEASAAHRDLRTQQLEALFMLNENRTDPANHKLWQAIEVQRKHESQLRQLLNGFCNKSYDINPEFGVLNLWGVNVKCALDPWWVSNESLSLSICDDKYKVPAGIVRDAVMADVPKKGPFTKTMTDPRANSIQLRLPQQLEEDARVTKADIAARDYHHLRSKPRMQITLTLAYFSRTRNLAKLSNEANQRYVEANLFQPGLLLDLLSHPYPKSAFLKQFDTFLDNGIHYYSKKGQPQRDALLFVRLNFLVNRYLALNKHPEGLQRLKNDTAVLKSYLAEAHHLPEVEYNLQQYLFLNLMTQIECGAVPGELYTAALRALFYLQSHNNPGILEDNAHRLEMETAIARLQQLTLSLPREFVEKIVVEVLGSSKLDNAEAYGLSGHFPQYQWANAAGSTYDVNVLQGKIYKNGLTKSSLPYVIQNHPLLKHLHLDKIQDCFMNTDKNYYLLRDKGAEVRLYYDNDKLVVQKEWTVDGQSAFYELKPLSEHHAPFLANPQWSNILYHSLPKPLTDGRMAYWQKVDDAHSGLLTEQHHIVYKKQNGHFIHLSPLSNKEQTILNAFESNPFLVVHDDASTRLIQLPRYGLSFVSAQSGSMLETTDTGEWVDTKTPSPIHPSVSGLVLRLKGKKEKQARFLVPVARVYAKQDFSMDPAGFYPFLHDTTGIIADQALKKLWEKKRPAVQPLWEYQNSEAYVSFRLNAKGEPMADTPADSLYLAYLYLASNQTEKAWKVLEACGDLQGSAQELQFLSWICKDMPHILPEANDDEKKATRCTPPYVACQLKALSLACKHLSQDKGFETLTTSFKEGTSNAVYADLQKQSQEAFLQSLPGTIYNSFDLALRMDRHLEGIYGLKDKETRQLLNYYHKKVGGEAKGVLGLVWLRLDIALLVKERDALMAHKTLLDLTPAEKSRLEVIEQHLQELKAVRKNHSALTLQPITIENRFPIHFNALNFQVMHDWNAWQIKPFPAITGNLPALELAVADLSSEMSDELFMQHFFSYLEIARGDNQALRKSLNDFCAHTLLATRHLDLYSEESRLANFIPVLCNFLYHVMDNQARFRTFLGTDPKKVVDFSLLEAEVSRYACKPLSVYEIENLSSDVLKTPTQIIKEVEEARPKNILPLSVPKATIAVLGAADAPDLQALFTEYRELEKQPLATLADLGKQVKATPTELPKLEDDAGKVLFKLEQEQRAFAEKVDKAALRLAAEQGAKALVTAVDSAWDTAITLADRGPANADDAIMMRLDKASKKRAPLTRATLKALYLRADAAHTMAVTGLSHEDAKTLHQNIHQALVLGIRQQMLDKAAKNLKKFDKKNATLAPGAKPVRLDLVSQALDFMAKDAIPGLTEPTLVLLQHEEKLMLRARQEEAITALLSQGLDGKTFAEMVEKIIMGGGKSKVLLPILAEKKARGNNLVVIEVPQALLPTNHAELSRTSKNLFGKEATRFEFNRDSNSSSQRLKELYQQFTEIMTNRGYLVTTGESIQSLELKYVELLLISEEERTDDWDKQIYWCDKIVSLFRNCGDCLIDEVHQGLWINKKLNYTTGEPKPLSSLIFKNATTLYGLLDKEFIRAAQNFKDDYDWTGFKTDIVEKLLNGPLASLAKEEESARILRAYLTNQADELSSLTLSTDEKSSLAYFKEQVNSLLPQTLSRRLDEHYGASKLKDLKPVEYTLAIPYIANNVPNETSRFGNELEAINYSIQMMLLNGLSRDLLKEKIIAWQESARQELLKNRNITELDNTKIGRSFKIMVKPLGLTLSQVSVNDADIVDELHDFLKDDFSLISEILQEKSLPQIRREQAVIHSDAYNHADLYNTVQGVSGTPANHLTYHQRLSYNASTSLGTDSYILEVLKAKETKITGIDYQDLKQFVAACLGRNERTRALIDIAAFFKGVSNLQVAEEIALYFRTKQDAKHPKPSDLKHVLYFNEDQQLCALSVDKPGVIIRLASSDIKELNQKLGTKPEQRFTYFDQVHTLGTDITQTGDAHALVLVDDKISLPAFLQGAMRMRQLSQGQTEELIVPTALEKTNLDELVKGYKLADDQRAIKDAPVAARGMMDNIGRRKGLLDVLNVPSDQPKEKARVAACFKDFFVETPEANLTKLYGGLSKPDAIDNILEKHKNGVVTKWKNGHAAATNCEPTALSEEMEQPLRKELQAPIDKIRPHCAPEYETKEDLSGQEVQIQKQIQKETKKEIHKTQINECHDPNRREQAFVPWPNVVNGILSEHDWFKPLNTICRQQIFSENLVVSANYFKTYVGQKEENYLGAFLKPGFCTWYQMKEGKLYAMLISNEDADDLRPKIASIKDSWISASDDTPLPGTVRPALMLENSQYQFLREQVRFFNGELDLLSTQSTPLDWLREHTEAKLQFFEDRLMSCRPGSEEDFPILKDILTKSNLLGFDYIGNNPYKDYTNFEWLTHIPDLLPMQVVECQRLAEAFKDMNANWWKADLDPLYLQQKYQLPMQSLIYLEGHKSSFDNFVNVMTYLQTQSLDNLSFPFINTMPAAWKADFKKMTGVDEGYPNEAPPELIAAVNIQALLRLWDHPAFSKCTEYEEHLAKLVENNHQNCLPLLRAFEQVKKPSELIFQKILASDNCDYALAKTLVAKLESPSDALLLSLVSKCRSTEDLEEVVNQYKDNRLVCEAVAGHEQLSVSLAYQILAAHPNESIIMMNLIKRAAEMVLRDYSCREWSDCFVDILKSNPDKQELKIQVISGVMKKPDTWSVNMSFTLLRTLGKRIKPWFNIPHMISMATEEELIWLADPKHLTLKPEELNILIAASSSAEGIKVLLDRPNLEEAQIASLLAKPACDDTAKETLAKETKSALILQTLITAGKPSEALVQKCLLNILCDKKMKTDLIANLPGDVSENLLLELVKQSESEDQLRLLMTKSLVIPVIKAIVAHKAFTSKLGVELVNLPNLPEEFISEEFILALATQGFKDCVLHADKPEKIQELEQLLNAGLAKNLKDKLISMVKQTKTFPANLGFALLRILGKDVVPGLPLSTMIPAATETELTHLANPDNTGVLDAPSLSILASRVNTRSLVDMVLTRKELTAPAATILFAKPINTQQWLEDEAGNTRSEVKLKVLLHHAKASLTLIDKVMSNPACSVQLIDGVCKDLVMPSEPLLTALAKKCTTVQQLSQVSRHGQGKAAVIPHILNNAAFAPEVATMMLTTKPSQDTLRSLFAKIVTAAANDTLPTNWDGAFDKAQGYAAEEDILDLLKDNKLAQQARFGFKLLKQYGKNLAPQLPLTEMVAAGDEQELNQLAELDLSTPTLDALAKKVVGTAVIDKLLARADMTEDIAKHLLDKPSFSGTIGSWTWLSADYAATLVRKAKDFDNFNRILSEHLTTSKARKDLLNAMQQSFSDARARDKDSTDPRTLLMLSLQELECKVYTHTLNAISSPTSQYPQAAHAAFDLHQGLLKEVQRHYDAKTSTKAELQQNCQALMDTHSPELAVHRGYKQWLLDFVNVLLICLTLGIGSGQRQSWRFFVANTDSINVTEKITANLTP